MSNTLKLNFLKKRLLGHKIKINNPTEVIKKCIQLGYSDMMDVGIYYLDTHLPKGDPQKKINNDSRKNKFYNLLITHNFRFSVELIKDTINLFGPNEIITNKENKYVTRFGLAQKFVNMTFKYLYIYSEKINQTIDFSLCDCPLDSFIIKKLNLDTSYTWSKLTPQDYADLKKIIDNNVKEKEEYIYLGRLLYDFKYW